MKFLSLLFTSLLAAVMVHAEEVAPAHPLKPMLWKVEGRGLEKPSWLFGTIHVGSGPVGTLHPAAAEALKDSDAVYTEVPMDMVSQLGMAKHFLRTDGKRLKDSIGEELSKELNAEIAAVRPGLDAAPFQALKTWAVAVSLPMLKLQLDGTKPLDMMVWNQAHEAGKITAALEKPEDQFGIFDQLTEEDQVILLAESVRLQKEARLEEDDPLQDLIEAYISGEDKKVEQELDKHFTELAEGEHEELGEELVKALIDDRNLDMAKSMDERMQAQPGQSHFFAVGTGHYIGRKNIGGLLTQKGYKISRITE